MKKLISFCLIALMSTNILFAQATDDNEIRIDQEGDTLTLYIDQVGFGNKVANNSDADEKMVITVRIHILRAECCGPLILGMIYYCVIRTFHG